MNTHSSIDRQERIKDLEWFISRREDDRELRDAIVELKVLGISWDLFDNIFAFDELYSRFSEYEDSKIQSIFMDWMDAYMANIEKTRNSGRVLLMGEDVELVTARTLENLQKVIWNYPGDLQNCFKSIQSVKKYTEASSFIDSLKEDFRSKGVLGDDMKRIPLQEQHEILYKVYQSETVQWKILQRICAQLPSYTWDKCHWHEVATIVAEINKQRNNWGSIK